MTGFILNRWPHFSNFLNLFSANLTKPAQRHLAAWLIALLIYDGRKNIAGLNRALFAPQHPSSLNRFLSEANWDEQQLEQIRQAELNRRIRRYLDRHQAKGVKVPAMLCIIETFHANVKELRGLDHNQAWREQSVRRQCLLVLLAYTYLALEAAEAEAENYAEYGQGPSSRVSVGQVVSWHKREAHCGQVEWVYQRAKAGLPLDELLKCVAA